MFVGSVCALAHGAGMPVMILIFGEMIDVFVDNSTSAENVTEYVWTVGHPPKSEEQTHIKTDTICNRVKSCKVE